MGPLENASTLNQSRLPSPNNHFLHVILDKRLRSDETHFLAHITCVSVLTISTITYDCFKLVYLKVQVGELLGWLTLRILALGRLMQVDCFEYEASLGCPKVARCSGAYL